MTILYSADYTDTNIMLGQFHMTLKHFPYSIYFVSLIIFLSNVQYHMAGKNPSFLGTALTKARSKGSIW